MCFVPVQLGQADSPVLQADAGDPLALASVAEAVRPPRPRQLADAGASGNGLRMRNAADDVEVHGRVAHAALGPRGGSQNARGRSITHGHPLPGSTGDRSPSRRARRPRGRWLTRNATHSSVWKGTSTPRRVSRTASTTMGPVTPAGCGENVLSERDSAARWLTSGTTAPAGHGFDQPPTEPRASRERAVFDRAQEGGEKGARVVRMGSENARWRHSSISLLWYELWYDSRNLLFLFGYWRRGRPPEQRFQSLP